MKYTKWLLLLVLLASLVLGLAACGGDTEPTSPPAVEPTVASQAEPTDEPTLEPTQAPEPTTAPTDTPLPEPTDTPLPEPTDTPEVEVEEEEEEFDPIILVLHSRFEQLQVNDARDHDGDR